MSVVAVSGGGKSSLLQAGLAKGLRDRPVVGLAQRIRCYLRVSGQPHTGLLHSLAQHGVLLPQELAAAPPQKLAAAIHGAVPATEVIMVVDQFERLYTDCEDAERERFLELLRCLATDTVKVVIGLRADFYHLALADLGERLAAGQVALAPMSEQDLGQAITAPAGKLLRSLQPGLIQQLIADVRGRPGDLPLLQFALTELWERDAAGGVLTEETYRGLGVDLPDGTRLPGVQGALIRRAELLWQDLDPAARPRLQRILLGLIAAPTETGAADLASGTRDLSRPVSRSGTKRISASSSGSSRPGCSPRIRPPRAASPPSRSPTRHCCAPGPACGTGWKGAVSSCSGALRTFPPIWSAGSTATRIPSSCCQDPCSSRRCDGSVTSRTSSPGHQQATSRPASSTAFAAAA